MSAERRCSLAALMTTAVLAALLAGCAPGPPDGSPTTTGPAPTSTTTSAAAATTTTEATTTSSSSTTTSTAVPVVTSAPATTAPRPVPTTPAVSTPAAGPLRSGRATHFRLGSLGNCSLPGYPGPDRLFVAMNAADYGTADLCGAHLAVQGNRGSVVVKVVDQCPECPSGALDLSEEAFARVTGDAGVTNVQWRVISGPAQPPISYRIKEGSSQWWVGILAIDHRNPVRSLEALVGGRWVALERQDYNYFLAPKGLGPGPFDVRLTDTYGERVISSGLSPEAGRVFTTGQQFAGH